MDEQVVREEDEDVNQIQIRCEILQATIECYPENNGIVDRI